MAADTVQADAWVARFNEEAELITALMRLNEAGHPAEDAYCPYPIHGLEKHLRLESSRLGWVTFAAGAFGALSAFGFQVWTSAHSWPVNVGGKPNVSTLAFIPITFEAMVLCAGLATAAAFLFRTRLYPRLRVPVLERVTDDRFALSVDPRRGDLDRDDLRRILTEAGARSIDEGGLEA